MRSRTVSLPRPRWRATDSSPPICRASSSRRRSSSSSGSHDMGVGGYARARRAARDLPLARDRRGEGEHGVRSRALPRPARQQRGGAGLVRRAAVALLLVFAGCGGSDRTAATTTARPASPLQSVPKQRPPTDDEIRRALLLPDRVPIRATHTASPAEVRVVRGWLDALRAGHIRAAAGYFSLPARFQNFTSIAIMKTPAQALAVNQSLPCGARFLRAGTAHGFLVYEARLTERPGGGCGTGVGNVVRGAILIRDGKMIEWYRLPDKGVLEQSAAGGETVA